MTTIFQGRYDDLTPGLKSLADVLERRENAEARGRRESDTPPEVAPRIPSWREIGAVVFLVSMAYSVGYNWREVSNLRKEYDAHLMMESDPQRGFIPREVGETRYRLLIEELARINKTLEQLRDQKPR